MDKDKKVNLIWVMVLVPIIFNIFGAIAAAMTPEVGQMLKTVAMRLIAIAVLTSIPYAAGKLLKR